MARKLSRLLDAEEPLFSHALKQLEKTSGEREGADCPTDLRA